MYQWPSTLCISGAQTWLPLAERLSLGFQTTCHGAVINPVSDFEALMQIASMFPLQLEAE
jgi:hypothetical protein